MRGGIFLADDPVLREQAEEGEDTWKSLLAGIDLQICLMLAVKKQLEAYAEAGSQNVCRVYERRSRYGRSGYMADVELDEKGEIASIRYDWVEE